MWYFIAQFVCDDKCGCVCLELGFFVLDKTGLGWEECWGVGKGVREREVWEVWFVVYC